MNEKLIRLLQQSPRVNLNNITNFKKKPRPNKRGNYSYENKHKIYDIIRPGPGFEEFRPLPWFLTVPKYGYNREAPNKRNYQPFTLWQLQRLIDLGRINPSKPIDLTSIIQCRGLENYTEDDLGFGLVLTEQGSNIFKAKVNLEVQIANDVTIAAVEKNGGTITTAYYDKIGVSILRNPAAFFMKGKPIPKRILPPCDLIDYYTDPETRGYLSDPEKINKSRNEFGLKFGYELPNIKNDDNYEMFTSRKDPRQLFFGLAPGWIVNLHEKNIIKPVDESVNEYYET